MIGILTEEIWTQTWTQGERHENMKAEIYEQGMPKIGGKPPELGEKQGMDHPSPPSKGTNEAGTLILDF